MSAAEVKANEESEAIEKYVMGMIESLDALPLFRIHNMLKFFYPDGQYDKTEGQLQGFLDALVAEGKLECVGGLYGAARKEEQEEEDGGGGGQRS